MFHMRLPSVYRIGYERARILDPALAARYVEHTAIGDPAADAAVDALAGLDPQDTHRFIQAGMEQDTRVLAGAPQPLTDFFERLEIPPAWFDPATLRAGHRAFHEHSALFLLAFLGDVLVRGFATQISRSFLLTGRVMDNGVRRLRQNILHLVEIMMPGSLDRQGDGWKLSVRIRIVHARIRRLLSRFDEWDSPAWGVPISAAHVAWASTGFSVQLLDAASRLGARLNDEERASFMRTWRYTARLIGVPDAILFRDEDDARALYRIGRVCEPPPGTESIIMANALINSAPLVIGVSDPAERRALASYGYRISRALIGDELADALRFPGHRTVGLLAWLRWKRRMETVLGGWIPTSGRSRARQFETLLDISALADREISYRLPDQVYSDQSREW